MDRSAFIHEPIPVWTGPDGEFPTRIDWINAMLAASPSQQDAVESSPLEASHGSNHRARSAEFFAVLHGSFAGIARITKGGSHIGSGCAVRAADLGFSRLDEDVVLTACHVLFDPKKSRGSRLSKRAELIRVSFDERYPRQSCACEVIWASPVDVLDVCVLRLIPPPIYIPRHFEIPALPIAHDDPEEFVPNDSGGGRRRQRSFLLSHPFGGPASATIEDNHFHGSAVRSGTTFPTFLRYKCPTAPGSSGGAVLNEHLQLVGIHRAGAATLHDGVTVDKTVAGVNEGVSIQSIREAIAESPAAKTEAPRKSFLARLMSTFEPLRTR